MRHTAYSTSWVMATRREKEVVQRRHSEGGKGTNSKIVSTERENYGNDVKCLLFLIKSIQ
ncbi:hypothetical protein LX69_00456 [Breznakibacter xylanolyticus]|uniref:Uncharacterized protein n=1 Tax=Breznakibacter xylanolyticus TaxID=990 RepID=A0A2W7P3L3_9BACT|nr:hypothetical protein LX69_00456 [Breznakibacter xylanolyticus]